MHKNGIKLLYRLKILQKLNVKNVKVDFDGLSKEIVFSFGDINSGEDATAVGGILPEDPGSLQVKADNNLRNS